MSTIHILRGPSELLAEERDEALRWCFHERKRHAGLWQLMGDKEPSYYGPVWVYRCDGCGGDYRQFPGT